ncbi:uncharacterized protein LOC116291995 isoform X2 [Actinia tenebrosa]|uniref:Uncharacterized protein LOC116291995 isoform X2 n=1 Tax=Actinia tenebrosa TaxID=6105 RepID=A0A6P8HQY2_ACTTE|nr:uncharacterized protein LOC116291995 isoform X2 [Actinia tenebrosa]
MSFMGNRGINLQGIYVGDLIDGNVNSVLSLCGNLRRRFEGSRADTPEQTRPASSSSVKENEQLKLYKFTNGHLVNGLKEFDSEVKPHGHSSGYHSEEHSPTRNSVPQVGLEMPGMMIDTDTTLRTARTVHPTDVIVSTTKLDRKAVYQSGAEHRKHITSPPIRQDQEDSDLISPSVEDRLRSLLCTPNPGGQSFEEDTEDEFVIPPRRTSDSRAEDRFDVEERLKSLLDDAAEGFDEDEDDDDDEEQRRIETIKELDAIGYMPSHPSDKMRNIPSKNERKDSFTGRTKPRHTKLSTPPALRRVQNARLNQSSQDRNTDRQRKMSVTKGPGMSMNRSTIFSTEVLKPAQPNYHSQNSRRPQSFYSERDNRGERTPPPRERSSSHSEFLQQVASRLENEMGYRDTTTTSSGSISPAETPMLPELSPGSSIASLVINSSSDSSGMITPVRNYYNKLKGGRKSPRHSGTSTPKKRGRGKAGSSHLSGHGKARSTNDLESIRTQIQSLESMYNDVLLLLDDGIHDSNKKLNAKDKSAGNQKTDDLRAGIVAFSKQRSKDIKAVNKRFVRLESHVVTLARSIVHLFSEL